MRTRIRERKSPVIKAIPISANLNIGVLERCRVDCSVPLAVQRPDKLIGVHLSDSPQSPIGVINTGLEHPEVPMVCDQHDVIS